MKKYLVILFACTLIVGISEAQSTFQPKQLDFSNEGIVYNKELAIDLRLHTNGFALAANIGKIKTYYLTRYYHFEIGELKHPKEYRQNLENFRSGSTSRSFIYGKQNNLSYSEQAWVRNAIFRKKRSEKAWRLVFPMKLAFL